MNAIAVALIVLAGVLGAAAAGKIRGAGDLSVWRQMRVPARLLRPGLVRAHPWAELALAVALVALPGVWAVVPAVTALVLCLVYLVLVARIVFGPGTASCGCFGETPVEVTGWTLARNVALVALAILGVVAAASGAGAWQAVTHAPATTGIVALAAVTTWLVGRTSASAARGESPSVPAKTAYFGGSGQPEAQEELPARLDLSDGQPHPLGDVSVMDAEGRRVALEALASNGPARIIYLSPGCGPCKAVGQQVATWREMTGEAIYLVSTLPLDLVAEYYPGNEQWALRDEGRTLQQRLGLSTPSTVQVLPGGLVQGPVQAGQAAVTAAVLGRHVEEDVEDYVPTPIPDVHVVTSSGAEALTDIVQYGPVLMVNQADDELRQFISTMRSSLRPVRTFLLGTDDEPGDVMVEAMCPVGDPGRAATTALGLGPQGAVLLGTTGEVSGGPVHGRDDIVEFVRDIAVQLAQAQGADDHR